MDMQTYFNDEMDSGIDHFNLDTVLEDLEANDIACSDIGFDDDEDFIPMSNIWED